MSMFTPISWSRRPGRWLIITATFEFVLAAVFFVIGLMQPTVRIGFFLTAAVLGLFGVGLLLWRRRWQQGYAEAQLIRTRGVTGEATVVAMRQTGVYLNDQPQVELTLQVEDQMHGGHQVVLKEYVPLMLLGTLTSGGSLPVKVDPANPDRVVVEWDSAMGGAPAAPGVSGPTQPTPASSRGLPQADADRERNRILAEGIPGTATILASSPTGQVDDRRRPIHRMTLQIKVQGRRPITGPALAGLPPERVDQLEVGDSLPIKADPQKPTSIAIDWDSV